MNFFGYQTPKGTKTGEQGHGPDGSTPEPTREEKVTVCRAVVNTLYDDQTWTNTPECNKTLTDALCRLYAAHGDNDSGVWIVADESIIKLVKLFTPRFGHLFGTTLAQLITGKPPMGLTGTRSLKSALIRFSEVCHLIFPKFIREMAQKGVIEDIFGRILSTADDVLLEALSQNIGKIYKTFGCYFTDEQADKLEGLFLYLLSNQSSQTRLYGSMCYTALAEHYPAPRFSQIVNKITHTEYTKIRKEEKDNSEKLSAYKHGVILCMLRLAKADTSKCMWDESPMKGVIEVMLSFCLDCIRITKKSYVLSNGLEVISYILSNHANEDTTWEGLDAMWDDLTAELAAIAVGAGEGSSRVSPVSISIGCLATLYKFRPKQTQKVLSEANADFMGTLRKLISSSDPAIRGSVSIFFGEVVSSTLFMHEELKDITLLDVVNELSDKLKEKLYSVKKSACTALGICLNACTRYGQKPEFYELATLIVTTLLGISADDYWVVRVEVARILSEVDYEVLAKNSQNMLGIQDQAFDFVLGLLESNDPKIRNPGSVYLARMVKHLWVPMAGEKHSKHSKSIKYLRYHKNLEYVIERLIGLSLTMHSVAQIKGIYHAFCAIGRKYGGSKEGGPNPLCCYSCELMPTLIERLTSTSLALDFDCHIDMLSLAEIISRGRTQYSEKFSVSILTHLLSVLNVICFVLKSKSTLPTADLYAGDSFFSQGVENPSFIGNCYDKQNYVDLFVRLHGNYFSNYTSTNENNLDKLRQLRKATLETLSTTIKDCRTLIDPFTEEIMSYLMTLYQYEPKETIRCFKEIFIGTFITKKFVTREQEKGASFYTDYDDNDFMTYWKHKLREAPQFKFGLREKRQTLRKYETVINMVKTTFYETTDQKCRGAILDLLSVLTRAGLNCSIIDSPERTFLLGALAQYQESNEAYFPNASKENLGGLLCFAQEMFVTRGNLEKVWKSGILSNIIELPQSVTSRVSWKTVFGGLAEATPMLFSAEDSDYLSYYIEKILKVVIRRLEPQTTQRMTTKFITQMLLLSKTHNKRWNSLSIISIESIMKYTNAPRLRDYDDVWRLCSLWRIVCPSAIEQVNWKSLVCSCPEPQEAQQDLTTEISQGSRLDTVLNRLGLSWLPGFVVGSRVGAENMPKEVLSKYTKDIGEKKLLESITKSVDLSVSRSIGLYHIESLKLCVIAVIDSARNLLARLKDVSQEDSFDTSLFFEDQLDKFCSLLNKDIVPGSVKGALCKYMRTLYQIEKAEKPLSRLFYALEANKDHKNDFLIDELSFYLSRCLKEKVPAMDQNVIEKIMMSGNKNTHRTLKGLFAPQNIETTFKVVETWAQRGDTYKGAEVYFSMIMQLPKSMETFELIANNLGHAKVGLLCVKLEKVLLGILKRVAKHTGKDRLSAAYEKIVSSTSDMSFVKLKAQLQKTLGGAQDNSHIFQSLTATKQPSSPEERDQEVEAREKETLVKCILKQIKLLAGDKTEAVSSLVELGGSYFKDVLFSGRLDKVIVPYVTRTENDTAKDVVCGYVKSIMNNEAEGPEHDFWEKDILACTLIDALEGEILMHVTYDELVPFVARVTCSFVERWRTASAKAASPPATLFDFCMIMRVTIFALFDNTRVTLDDPEVSKLVAGLYDAYSCVVLPQNLQAASVITRGLRQEGGTPEGKLRAFLAAQIVGGLAELEIFGKPFVHTLVLLEFTLARKFTGVLFPLPPRGAAANGKAGRIQDMPIYRMCQVHESPELALRIALNFISTAGVNSAREFYWVHKGLCSILSDTDNSSEISDELKCLALRGVTSLIVNACIHDTREERRKLILDPAVYAVKREYGLRRAKMINESMPLEEVMSLVDGKYAEVLGEDPGEQGSEGTASPSPLSSPKDEEAAAMSLRKQGVTDLNEMIKALFNIEHDKEAEFGAKLGYDPLPLSELSKKRTFHWSGLNVSRTISDFMCILDRILDVQALLEVEGDALRLTSLQCEAVHSLVVLSDVLVPAQSMWLFDNCLQLFDLLQYASADFALMRNLVVGVLKAAAQTNTPTPAVVDAINRVVYYSLLSDRIVVANGALLGLRFVMQASGREAFMPADLITVVTYYINEMVRTAQPEGTMLHLLSAGFDLIQAFPKASEELGFTETFTANAIAMCRTSSSLSSSSSRVVVQHIYKNLRLLLLCDAIDQSKRILIEDFALRALQGQGQPLRDSLAMGLLFTSMYARKDAFSLYASKRRGPKGAAEERRRFQTIFDYIKRQSDMQMTSPRLVDVLSQMMADLLTPEKSLELVLGELLGAPQSSRRVIARVMNRVLAMVEDKNEVFKTISVYVTKFGQDTPAATAAWLAACTLLSVSSDSTAMHNVFNYVLYEEDSVNNEILSLAAREALNVFKLEYNKRELATTLKKVYGVDV